MFLFFLFFFNLYISLLSLRETRNLFLVRGKGESASDKETWRAFAATFLRVKESHCKQVEAKVPQWCTSSALGWIIDSGALRDFSKYIFLKKRKEKKRTRTKGKGPLHLSGREQGFTADTGTSGVGGRRGGGKSSAASPPPPPHLRGGGRGQKDTCVFVWLTVSQHSGLPTHLAFHVRPDPQPQEPSLHRGFV